MDDRVPCDADGQCLFPTSASTTAGELWPWLLTKALLKLVARTYQVDSNAAIEEASGGGGGEGGGGGGGDGDGDEDESKSGEEAIAVPPLSELQNKDVALMAHWLTGWVINREDQVGRSVERTADIF